MSGATKAAGRKAEAPGSMPFEKALENLESIVAAMEEGELPLESLLVKYEEGTRLVKACQAKLEEAELKIKKLELNESGEAVLKPLDPEIESNDE